MTAMLMALNALAIDIMLPALPDMAVSFGLAVALEHPIQCPAVLDPNSNDQQLIIVSYMLGFGVSQLFYGPLTDRFGRRSVLFVSLSLLRRRRHRSASSPRPSTC